MSIFNGCCVAMVTPFSENGQINFPEVERIIHHLIDNKVDCICVCGTTGEPATMTETERNQMIEFTIKTVNKAIPVIVGCGCNCTAQTVQNAINAEKMGADALLIVTPYYNKCTQKGLIAHYTAINNAVHIPIVMYNVPGRTGVNMLPTTVKELSLLKNIKAIKEASGNIGQMQEILRICDDDFDVYSGDDDLATSAMFLGAKGVISVAANVVPDLMHEMTDYMIKGNYKKAVQMQFNLSPLIKNLFSEVNPIPVKKAMQFIGFKTGSPRLPLTEMEESHAEILKQSLKDLGR